MAESLSSSKSLRAGLRAAGKQDRWDMDKRKVAAGYSPHDVKIHCVQNDAWQRVRLSMKGVDTVVKIWILEAWYDKQMDEAQFMEANRGRAQEWATQVQVGNYLGALRRGGQLDDENRIRKAR